MEQYRQGGYEPLTPKQRLMALLELDDARWLWQQAHDLVNETLKGHGISEDQLASIATTWFLNSPPWVLRRNGLDPADVGERMPRLPGEVYQWLHKDDESDTGEPITEGQLTAMNSVLSKLFNDGERKAFIERMFRVDSSKKLTRGQAGAVIDWAGANEKNGWRPTKSAQVEAGLIKEVL